VGICVNVLRAKRWLAAEPERCPGRDVSRGIAQALPPATEINPGAKEASTHKRTVIKHLRQYDVLRLKESQVTEQFRSLGCKNLSIFRIVQHSYPIVTNCSIVNAALTDKSVTTALVLS
jgi:hypothetical protein